MNRVVIASVVSVLILIAALSGFIYFNKFGGTNSSTLKAVPADAAFILSVKLNRQNVQSILESRFIKNFIELDGVKKLETRLALYQKLITTNGDFRALSDENLITISLHPTKVDDYDMIFYTNTTGELSTTEITQKIQALFDTVTAEQTRNYVGVEVHDLTLINNVAFSYAVSSDIFIASFTPFLVEDALRQLKAGNAVSNAQAFKKLQIKDQPEADFTLYVNYNNLPNWLSVFCNQDNSNLESINAFADWSKLVVTLKNSICLLKGTTTFSDTSSFVSLFSNQSARNLKVFQVIPENTSVVKAFGISDKKSYFEKLKSYNAKFKNPNSSNKQTISSLLTDVLYDEYGLLITEPASTSYTNNCYAYFNVTNNQRAQSKLEQFTKDKTNNAKARIDKYRNHQITSTGLDNVLADWLGSSFNDVNHFYYTNISNYFFIGNSASALKLLIDSYEDKNLLGKSADYSTMQNNFSPVANYFYYAQLSNCHYLLKAKANSENILWIEENSDFVSRFDTYAFQIKNNGTALETAAYLHTVEKVKNKVSVLWAEQLDYPTEITPQLIETRDSGKYIAIQDTSHQLYLIDNAGIVVWRKQLDEKIISTVFALDVFKNGNRQLLFNTSSALWILNLKGEEVSNYPIKLPAPASCGLSAFDYEGTLDYRIFVPCSNGQIYGYLPSGKPLPRFSFKCQAGVIAEPISYFKINTTDYLLAVNSLGNLYGIDRFGKPVLTVNETLNKKPDAAFNILRDSTSFSFITVDSSGNKVAIDSAGNLVRTPVDYLNQIDFTNSNDGLQLQFTCFENRVTVTDESKNQLFAYSVPELLSGEIIVSNDNKGNPVYVFTSKNNAQVYMLNYKGKLVQGFPLKSIAKPQISDLNGDKIKRLILMSDSSTITVYSF